MFQFPRKFASYLTFHTFLYNFFIALLMINNQHFKKRSMIYRTPFNWFDDEPMKRRRNSRCGSYFTSLKEQYRRSKIRVVYDSSSDSEEESRSTENKPKEVVTSISVDPSVISTRCSSTQTTYTLTNTNANLGSSTIDVYSANHIKVCLTS